MAGNANEMFGFGMNPINRETFSPKNGIRKKRILTRKKIYEGSGMCV